MSHSDVNELKVGDRVVLSDSDVTAWGVIVEEVDDDYLRVRWDHSPISTTHRRHALAAAGATRH